MKLNDIRRAADYIRKHGGTFDSVPPSVFAPVASQADFSALAEISAPAEFQLRMKPTRFQAEIERHVGTGLRHSPVYDPTWGREMKNATGCGPARKTGPHPVKAIDLGKVRKILLAESLDGTKKADFKLHLAVQPHQRITVKM